MFRTNRMIAVVTLALWASGAAAQVQPGSEGASGQVPPQPPVAAPAPSTPVPSTPVPSTPAPITPIPGTQAAPATPPVAPPPASAPQVPQQGTPATVLDTQDYESLLGRSVRSAGGDELGRVIDIIIDKEGHPRAAIIDFGGFLGVGTRKIAVDWRALRFTADGNKERRLSVALSRNQVRVSPEYKSGEPIVVLGPASPAAVEGEQAVGQPAAPPAAPPSPAATPPASNAPAAPAAAPAKAPDK